MAAKQKFETIEAASAEMGVEINEKTRPFLMSFVKKAEGASASQKKTELIEEATRFGVQGIEADKENATTLQIKILTFLFENDRIDEMKTFATKYNLFVTDDGAIHRVRQAVKPIEQRNAGVKEGSVGYNTIQLLKDPEYSSLTAAELAEKQLEIYDQKTTSSCVQWYINYCHKKVEALKVLGEDPTPYEICERKRTARSNKAAEGGVALGAELTLEKAMKPRGFAKKKDNLGEDMAV